MAPEKDLLRVRTSPTAPACRKAACTRRLSGRQPSSHRKNMSCLRFSCVCPEPVLANAPVLYINGAKRRVFKCKTWTKKSCVFLTWLTSPIASSFRGDTCRNKRISLFFSTFPMLVPSLPWHNDLFYRTRYSSTTRQTG